MGAQIQKPKPHRRTVDEPVKAEVVDTEAVKADLDDLLNEIDAVLEENAEAFVNAYVQKGGE